MRFVLYSASAFLLLMASCSQKTSAPTAAKEKVYDGANIFAKNCARCHGAQGVKDERTPNLQTIALDKSGLIKSITNGKNRMPAFEDKLSAEEIAAVADLIVSWHR
ncbi:MAG: cytochrome c [Chitinophagales bacterium]|nr:cytochrome c [Chitinophagales bacterium]